MRPTGIVFLNGRFVAAGRAAISVFDRGLLYGDGLFETMRSYRGVAFALEQHLERLGRSARLLGITVPSHDWPAVLTALLRRNHLLRTDAAVRLTVTRGVCAPGILPREVPVATTIMSARRIGREYARARQRGVEVAVLPFSRNDFLAEHKSLNYLAPVLGRLLAAQHDADEGVFVDDSGHLCEGTTSSLFLVRHGVISTVPATGILPGITRRVVLDLAAQSGIAKAEQPLTRRDLSECDEAFLTSSVGEIVPVVKVGHEPVGTGRPGAITRALQRLYGEAVERYRAERGQKSGVRSQPRRSRG